MTQSEANSILTDLYADHNAPLFYRIAKRAFRRHINRFAKSIISEAFSRGLIKSCVFHECAAMIDRRLWPERYDKQREEALLIHPK